MGALVRTLLGLLGLLLAPARASEEGEVCLSWLPAIPVEGFLPFRCPQRPDGADGRFCCGICIKPYCCHSEEARLDQDQCLHAWRLLEFFVRVIMAGREKGSLPVLQHLQTIPTSDPKARGVRSIAGDTTPTPRPPFNKVKTVMVLLGVVCGLLSLPLLVFILCKCCLSTQDHAAAWLYCRRGGASPAGTNQPMTVRSDPRLPSSPPPSYRRSYEESPLLLPYTRGAPSNRARGEDGATVGPRRLILAVRASEQAAAQAPTTSGIRLRTGPTGAPAATAGEVTPVQEAAGKGKATPARGGEGASPLVVPSAPPGLIDLTPAPSSRDGNL